MLIAYIYYVLVFVLGSFVGSFLNVVIDRFPKKQTVIKSRSRCPKCKKTLKPLDLIPIISFTLLKGKCRYCKEKIDYTLPLVEIITAFVFVLLFTGVSGIGGIGNLGLIKIIYYLLISCVLIVVFFMDAKYRIIEDKVVIFGVLVWAFYTIIYNAYFFYSNYTFLKLDSFGKYLLQAGYLNNLGEKEIKVVLYSILSAVILFLFFYFLSVITKGRGMGGGDIKFSFLMGLIAGFPNVIPAFFISFLTGAFTGIILILLGKRTLKQTIPFGPFLVIGTAISMVFGNSIVRWYMQFMHY